MPPINLGALQIALGLYEPPKDPSGPLCFSRRLPCRLLCRGSAAACCWEQGGLQAHVEAWDG